MSTESPSRPSVPRWAWTLLLAVCLLLALTYSIIQPLGRCPDELAHVQYVQFLANEGRLPYWQAHGGGEAGYEAQHPPLYYAIMAVVYKAATPLEERWRWHVLRWATILLLGLPMFAISRRFFSEALTASPCLPFVATASVMLMPLVQLYTCHTNPDGLAMVWMTLALYLSWRAAARRIAADAEAVAIPWQEGLWLGLVAGLAALTKLSAAPALFVALAGQLYGGIRREHWRPLAATIATFLAVCGWYYARNAFLYGTPFIHTQGLMGTGLEAAMRTSFWQFAWLTWRNTYLSSWAQIGWFPPGFWNTLLYGVVVAMSLLALAGLVRQKRLRQQADLQGEREPLRRALNLSGLALALVFLGHQWAYWTMDVEFNAGGRYILVAMAGLVLLLLVGVRLCLGQAARPVFRGWLVALLVMNQVSVWCIWAVLNPRYAPGWQVFHFPPG
jgi:hypothetical protein